MLEIISDLKCFLFPALKELKSKINKNFDCIYLFSTSDHIFIRIFYNELDSELNKEIEELILDYIYFYYKYKLNLDNILSKELSKNIKNYIGYSTPLIMFNLDILHKKIRNKVDREINSIFPIIDIQFLPNFLKVTMPHFAKEV